MKFAAHGQFELTVEGRTVFLTLYGDYNTEGVQRVADALQTCVEQHLNDGLSWAVLLDLSHHTLATAQSEQSILEAYARSAAQQQSYEAVVGFTSSAQRHQMEKVLNAIAGSIEYRFFDRKPDARHWLTEKGML